MDAGHQASPRRPEPEGLQGNGTDSEGARGQRESESSKPFTVNVQLNVVQLFLFILALGTRFWHLDLPRAVVFDELHYTKFVSLYLKRTFFFDYSPPLGKMFFALTGYFMGYDGADNYDRIGQEYSANTPVYQFRFFPALFGSLLIPVVYSIIVEAGLSQWAALLAAGFLLLDNAMLVQSRLILLDSMLLFFLAFAVLSMLKFRKVMHRPFSVSWWVWMFLTGASLFCAVGIKYSSVLTAGIILYVIAKDYWRMLADTSYSDFSLLTHLNARILTLVAVPIALYIGMFYVHLSLLTTAGPHDNIMTSAFQASLEGGLAAITKGQPVHVAFGSQITLRRTHGGSRPCWLHSHSEVYPVKYPDNRGSSHQQQVTCYVYKDVNNWWIVKHPDSDNITVENPPVAVRHGDIVHIVHGKTKRALNSHDVAAPMSPECMEVSGYINYNVSMPAQILWRVEIINRESDEDTWQTIKSHVRLIHLNLSASLKVTHQKLPEWAFNQLEVVTDKKIDASSDSKSGVWNVEEHRYTTGLQEKDQARELELAQMLPTEITYLSFWAKFLELQRKMLFHVLPAEQEHKYSSKPWEWPLSSTNIAYWICPVSNAQIHLLGNPVIWYSATLAVLAYSALLVFYMMRRRRLIYDLPECDWDHFVLISELFLVGYLVNYLPYLLLTDKPLFLHHYLPALLFKILILAALVDHVHLLLSRLPLSHKILSSIAYTVTLLLFGAFVCFYKLAPLSYGSVSLSAAQLEQLQWLKNWEFIVQQA